jgi:hypothetical protein
VAGHNSNAENKFLVIIYCRRQAIIVFTPSGLASFSREAAALMVAGRWRFYAPEDPHDNAQRPQCAGARRRDCARSRSVPRKKRAKQGKIKLSMSMICR